MKNSDYQLVRLKWKIQENKNPKKFWSLNITQREYFENLGWEIEVALYKIPTRQLKNYSKTQNSLLKSIHHEYKKGKLYMAKQLNSRELRMLIELGFNVKPLKYKVTPRKN